MFLKSLFTVLTFLGVFTNAKSQIAWNVDLFAQTSRSDTRYSGSWAYIAPDGKEYALIGAKSGTAVYPIENPDSVNELGFVPGPETNWREITVIGQHAFVVTDVQGTGHSMQVIDLGYLPDSLHLLASYTTTFTTGHIIQKTIGSEEPYVYVMGTNTTQGLHIINVSNPAHPVEAGAYAPGYYIHDAHIRGNLLFAAAFYKNEIDIVDISDKSAPKLVGKINCNGKNTHSSSSTEDGKYLIVADEADGFPARIFNIENLENPVEVAQFTANDSSLVHNPYVRDDLCFVAHNTEGLRVLDIADPTLPVEVGYYDTWTGSSGGFRGLWSACPYFPSGKIIGANRHDGLYVWQFNETRAARIYGLVKDSLNGKPVSNALIEIAELPDTLLSNDHGNFKKGMLEGHFTLQVAAQGYEEKKLEIDLLQGDSLWLEISLKPETANATNGATSYPALLVFPNPFSTSATIDLRKLPDAARLVIFNDLGSEILNTGIEGRNSYVLEGNKMKTGVYIINVLNRNGSVVLSQSIVVHSP
jgi:choice-of-anchor B domain-containing protein